MTKRDVVRAVLEGRRPPYVPWSMGFTTEAKEKLQRHYGCHDLEVPLENMLAVIETVQEQPGLKAASATEVASHGDGDAGGLT